MPVYMVAPTILMHAGHVDCLEHTLKHGVLEHAASLHVCQALNKSRYKYPLMLKE